MDRKQTRTHARTHARTFFCRRRFTREGGREREREDAEQKQQLAFGKVEVKSDSVELPVLSKQFNCLQGSIAWCVWCQYGGGGGGGGASANRRHRNLPCSSARPRTKSPKPSLYCNIRMRRAMQDGMHVRFGGGGGQRTEATRNENEMSGAFMSPNVRRAATAHPLVLTYPPPPLTVHHQRSAVHHPTLDCMQDSFATCTRDTQVISGEDDRWCLHGDST
jgi:hypothetical protein